MVRTEDIIRADKDKVLFYKPENRIWGKAARLAKYKDHILTEDDFEEVSEDLIVVIDDKSYYFRGMSYAEIKMFVIKLHYSNDDQIALMLNYQSNPSKYEQAYQNMQNWRDYAGNIASKYVINK